MLAKGLARKSCIYRSKSDIVCRHSPTDIPSLWLHIKSYRVDSCGRGAVAAPLSMSPWDTPHSASYAQMDKRSTQHTYAVSSASLRTGALFRCDFTCRRLSLRHKNSLRSFLLPIKTDRQSEEVCIESSNVSTFQLCPYLVSCIKCAEQPCRRAVRQLE